ncbi:hypothetical protein CU633_05775 [Bacillus sp. V3-13]|nr:hypothetical protein CU633_05775 [Bacillus sp. V3-13]
MIITQIVLSKKHLPCKKALPELNKLHVSNVNSKGQLISSSSLKFNILGKTSGQISKMIEAEAIELVNIAHRANKPLAIEKLDTTKSKVSHPYGNKKANFKFNMFAYNKMVSAIKSRAEKMGVAVFGP